VGASGVADGLQARVQLVDVLLVVGVLPACLADDGAVAAADVPLGVLNAGKNKTGTNVMNLRIFLK
jgi:hypothetical protein